MSSYFRLSVIIPSLSLRASKLSTYSVRQAFFLERAVSSILNQTESDEFSPQTVEIVIVSTSLSRNWVEYLEGAFEREMRSERVRIVPFSENANPSSMCNFGASFARAPILSFVDPIDYWKPGRLQQIQPYLKKHDLILSSMDDVRIQEDWLPAFIRKNIGQPSSAIIRHSLFNEVGGFSENFFPCSDEYELWLTSLAALAKTNRMDRFVLLSGEGLSTQSLGQEVREVPIARIFNRTVAPIREWMTIAKIAHKLPLKYISTIGHRASLATLKKRRLVLDEKK